MGGTVNRRIDPHRRSPACRSRWHHPYISPRRSAESRAAGGGGDGREMVNEWLLYGHYMVMMWSLYGHYMVLIWLLYGCYMVFIWLLYGRYMVIIWLTMGINGGFP